MAVNREQRRAGAKMLGNIPFPQGADGGTKQLIGAVMAACTGSCDCDACQLLRKFGKSLSTAMLKEGDDGGHSDTQ